MAHILVIGDLMLDEYIYGEVSRISPEAPVPILKYESREVKLGGAANLAANIKALGSEVQVAGVYARDDAGQRLSAQCLKNKIELVNLVHNSQNQTTHKIRYVTNSQQMLRVDHEEYFQPNKVQIKEGASDLNTLLSKVDWVVLSDYAKGTLQEEWLQIILNPERTWKVLVDPKAQDWTKYNGADVITPNFSEFNIAVHTTFSHDLEEQIPLENSHESLVNYARKMCLNHSFKSILVTRGSRGMSLYQAPVSEQAVQDQVDPEQFIHPMDQVQEEYHQEFSAQAKDVYDVSGAGDTVLACVAQQLSSGADLKTAAQMSNLAASIAVSKKGTTVVTEAELQQTLKSLHWHHKLLTQNELLSQVRQARREGKKVVFTNGCFDVIHRGHIKYLQEARALGDLLILGLNSDESVQILKGPERPVNSQDDRAYVLGNLQSVDWICVFDEETPIDLIQAIRPDILVKGGDYTAEQVVGAEFAKSVKIVDYVEGYSTSNTLKKLGE